MQLRHSLLFRGACEHKATGGDGSEGSEFPTAWLPSCESSCGSSLHSRSCPELATTHSFLGRKKPPRVPVSAFRQAGQDAWGSGCSMGRGEGPDDSSCRQSRAVEAAKCVFSDPKRAEADPGSAL